MFPAPALPAFSRLDGAVMDPVGGHLFHFPALPENPLFSPGSYVTPGLSLMGETF